MVMGKVYLVGAGPGDPNLLTLRASQILGTADVVIHDELVTEEILERVPATAIKVCVAKGRHNCSQLRLVQVNELMVSEAKKGKNVVRLQGGDPFIFGRGGEELEHLIANSVDFEIVPGVSSATAVPASVGIPLTNRRYSSSVAIVTGHEDPSKDKPRVRWSQLASSVDTIVILMGASTFRKISRELLDSGMTRDTPIAVIEWGTTKRQKEKYTTLGEAAEDTSIDSLNPPCVIVVGKVAEFANVKIDSGKESRG